MSIPLGSRRYDPSGLRQLPEANVTHVKFEFAGNAGGVPVSISNFQVNIVVLALPSLQNSKLTLFELSPRSERFSRLYHSGSSTSAIEGAILKIHIQGIDSEGFSVTSASIRTLVLMSCQVGGDCSDPAELLMTYDNRKRSFIGTLFAKAPVGSYEVWLGKVHTNQGVYVVQPTGLVSCSIPTNYSACPPLRIIIKPNSDQTSTTVQLASGIGAGALFVLLISGLLYYVSKNVAKAKALFLSFLKNEVRMFSHLPALHAFFSI